MPEKSQPSPAANRRYKDTVFRDLFGSPERKGNALELYNALAGTDYEDPDELELTTLDDVIYLNYKNDVSFMVGDELVLVEHQSTPNPNMPLRGLVYFGRLYAAIADKLGNRLYGRALAQIPPARFAVIYCGPAGAHSPGELRLSDAFGGRESDIEVRCRVVDVGSEAAAPVLAASPILAAYAELVRRAEAYREIMGLDGAVKRAIDEMVEEGGALSEYLRAKRAEVADMFMTEFDAEGLREFDRNEGFEEGVGQTEAALLKHLREMGVDESTLAKASEATRADLANRPLSR